MNPAKLIIVAALVAVIASLGSALYHLSSTSGDSAKMLKALKLRIAISVGLFVLLFVAWWLGLIAPHGLNQ
jgi:cytochrome bd-type quinol oxidase subunit 2